MIKYPSKGEKRVMNNENSAQMEPACYEDIRYDFRMTMEFLKIIDLYNFLEIESAIKLIDKKDLKEFFEKVENAVKEGKTGSEVCSAVDKGLLKREEVSLYFDAFNNTMYVLHSAQTPLGVKAKTFKIMRSQRDIEKLDMCKQNVIAEITEHNKNEHRKTSVYGVARNIDGIIITKTDDNCKPYICKKIEEMPCYYADLEIRTEDDEPEEE